MRGTAALEFALFVPLLLIMLVYLVELGNGVAEARGPVGSGPYALVRHPLYLAEQIALLGALITYLSWPAVALFALQSCFQFMRARNEECVLARTFPAYANYLRRTPMLLPHLFPHRGAH